MKKRAFPAESAWKYVLLTTSVWLTASLYGEATVHIVWPASAAVRRSASSIKKPAWAREDTGLVTRTTKEN